MHRGTRSRQQLSLKIMHTTYFISVSVFLLQRIQHLENEILEPLKSMSLQHTTTISTQDSLKIPMYSMSHPHLVG